MPGVDTTDARTHVVPVLMLATLSVLVLLSWLLAPKGRPVVVVYGDSLTVQSESAALSVHPGLRERVVFRAYGGTAICDWVSRAAVDRVALSPKRVVLAFTGNTASCAAAAFRTGGVAGVTALYEESLREMHAVLPGVPVTVVIPPAMHNLPTGWYPYNGNPALVAMYKRVAAQLHMTINTRADDWLTPGHVFTTTRPAYPHGPPTIMRLSDGVHLTPAGALWYGAALLD